MSSQTLSGPHMQSVQTHSDRADLFAPHGVRVNPENQT
jgi:hypothetical protein